MSHWSELLRGIEISPIQFYMSVRSAIEQRRLPDVDLGLVAMREGGIFSDKREYLRVIRKDNVVDICGAPYGDGFFVSYWVGPRPRGFLLLLLSLPFGLHHVVSWVYFKHLRPDTYYGVDTASMFMTAVHSAVMEVVDQLMEARGLRALTELQRKPIHRNFFGK